MPGNIIIQADVDLKFVESFYGKFNLLKDKKPLFLCGGDEVCYKGQTCNILGSSACIRNMKLQVIRSLLDRHFHIYDVGMENGVTEYEVPRNELTFRSRHDSDNNMMQAAYGALRKYQNLSVSHPEDVLDPNDKIIPPGTYCIFVDFVNAWCNNCRVLDYDYDEGNNRYYLIELENGLCFRRVPRDVLYVNEHNKFYPNV